jgi:nucleoside-triphosphatase THEP1
MRNKSSHNSNLQPTEKWIKASILGTTWASSEIVLGSFLHNLRVPFSGNILTAIGLVILISASYLWKERGLFWRAGVICALLKTMSPSAVIFGPMIAIFSEALLLEIAVRIFGKNLIGFMIGSILAMAWILVQRIVNFIIFYGSGIVDLYANLMQFAAKQFNWKFDVVWAPILLLLSGYAVFGILAAWVGIKTGKNLRNRNLSESELPRRNPFYNSFGSKGKSFKHSVAWLMANILFLAAALLLANKFPFSYWSILVVSVVVIWAIRYKRALRQLMRPKFWIFFFLITMLTSLLFTGFPADQANLLNGLTIGVKMNMRAIILIMGFTVLGTELYNPKIRNFFHNSLFRQVSMSLELSLETLPAMIEQIPDLKTIARNPVSIISQVLLQAEQHLENFHKGKTKVFLLSGTISQGKTSLALRLADKLKSEGKKIHGIISEKNMEGDKTTGYNLLDLDTKFSKPFLILRNETNTQAIGRFSILPEGLRFGAEVLERSVSANADLIIVDEAGKLELADGGWADAVEKILASKGNNLLLIARDEFVSKLIDKWKITPVEIYSAGNDDILEISTYLGNDKKRPEM